MVRPVASLAAASEGYDVIPLSGKTAIVTGAAAGVGLATARQLLERGARVMIADPDDAALEQAYTELSGSGGAIERFPYEVQDKLSVANLIAATLDAFDRLDVLVNDVRMSVPGSFRELSPDTFNQVLTQNVRSVFLLCQQAAKRMAQNRTQQSPAGSIVTISSIAAERTLPELLSYSVSCAALNQLVRSMAACLASDGIRVNAVALGSVMTRTLRDAVRERSALRDEMIAVTPLGRIGDADEAAAAAVFLASDEASFITGQILSVDGGRTVLDPLAAPER